MNQDRITYLIKGNCQESKEYVLYWMQQSARVSYNHALLYAIEKANEKKLPLLVCFLLSDGYLDANRRHYKFALEGLKEVESQLKRLNISFVIKLGDPTETIKSLLLKADTFIMDYGYLKPQLRWRRTIYDYIKKNELDIDTYMIESDVLIPVRKAYPKLAYGAYVLRPKIHNKKFLYRDFYGLNEIINKEMINELSDINLNDIESILNNLHIDQSVKPYYKFKGGYEETIKHLELFLDSKIVYYEKRNDPSLQIQSYLSIYLHFGQISVLEILDYVEKYLNERKIEKEVYDEFFEQLVVRRELSFNYVTYQPQYDLFEYMTEKWAYETMDRHQHDPREYVYSIEDIEYSKTHDIYFNAAMTEMKITGFMSSYLRMYWAKKIMEWSLNMKVAYERIVYLNNKYFLDGRDPNSYQNIAWCFGKSDRPWQERNIFGTLRYMNSDGLKRKFNIDEYVKEINLMAEKEML